LRDHIVALAQAGLLVKIDVLINKDTEAMSLLRWQFRELAQEERRQAFPMPLQREYPSA